MAGGLRLITAGLLLAGGACGCQCAPLTGHYADAVDHIADHELALDGLYHPGLDLTRIGRSDWCRCGINRSLCRCACERRKPLPHIIETSAASYVGAHLRVDGGPYAEPTDTEPTDGEPTDGEPTDAEPTDTEPGSAEPTWEMPPADPDGGMGKGAAPSASQIRSPVHLPRERR